MDIKTMSDLIRFDKIDLLLPANKASQEELIADLYYGIEYNVNQLLHAKDDEERINYFCHAIYYFLQIGNRKDWVYLLQVDDDFVDNTKSKWKMMSWATFYLIFNKQLNDSYFLRKLDSFKHAWHLLIKLGINDLNLDLDKIEVSFMQIYSKN